MEEFFLWADSIARLTNKEFRDIAKLYSEYNRCENPNKNSITNYTEYDEFNSIDFKKYLEGFILCAEKSSRFKKATIDKMKSSVVDSMVIVSLKESMKNLGVDYISIDSNNYPSILKEIYDPPYVLYFRGDISVLKEKFILGMVGSRDATEYGRAVSKKIIQEISDDRIAIVSGLARGIDSYSHIFCMNENMKTIAVLGSAIDNIYPKINVQLANEIIKNGGLIISEHNIGKNTMPYHFALRNRIISGISNGVIVVEAKRNSGALVTCESALSQNRNVYSVPGSIFSKFSQGCNEIISKGAKPIQSGRDVLEDFDYIFRLKEYRERLKKEDNINAVEDMYTDKKYYNKNKFDKSTRKTTDTCVNIKLGDDRSDSIGIDEKRLMELLSDNGELNIDQIVVMTGMSVGKVLVVINRLLFLDLIAEVDSNTYAKK